MNIFYATMSLHNWGLYLIQALKSVEWLGFSEIRLVEAVVEAFPLWELSCPRELCSGGL